MLKIEDIRMRDPFILTDTENGCYYMYGTTDLYPNSTRSYDRFSILSTPNSALTAKLSVAYR
ncbi:MAG: hypothetical protein IJO96_08705 [Oscillospiraceae bacterium]|nr:hypothetical protein [Oscillospiraceae bacterium]